LPYATKKREDSYMLKDMNFSDAAYTFFTVRHNHHIAMLRYKHPRHIALLREKKRALEKLRKIAPTDASPLFDRLQEIIDIQTDVETGYLYICGSRDCFALTQFNTAYINSYYTYVPDDELDECDKGVFTLDS
jgi:hypothetical protein